MLKEIHDKINEILAKNNIDRNKIDPWENARLELIEASLAETITRLKNQAGGN